MPFGRASAERTVEFAGERTGVGLAADRTIDALLEPALVRARTLG